MCLILGVDNKIHILWTGILNMNKIANSYRKKPPDESHKYTKRTHGNLTDTFRQSQNLLNQKRINICEHTVKMAPRDSFD